MKTDLLSAARKVEMLLGRQRVKFTLGGEPTYVPLQPEGSEWSITALGPTKLRFGYGLAAALQAKATPGSLAIFSPGKIYPGEVNPRWSINLVWREDGKPLVRWTASQASLREPVLRLVRSALDRELGIRGHWMRAQDPLAPKRSAWVLPLDYQGRKFVAEDWRLGLKLDLIGAEGPVGLRLPLSRTPENCSRRALTLDVEDGRLRVFLPPLRQAPWMRLLRALGVALGAAGCGEPVLSGYVPGDEAGVWSRLAITADPGVLEINLPPCPKWEDYARWLEVLEETCAEAGLRSFKQIAPGEEAGTGGGNHLLFGGPTLEENAFFTQPRWLISILRYWQLHPALAYFFTGPYVGSASQAPRPDECVSSLYDLEMAYQFLEQLPAGQDHRYLVGETLRHLHTDSSGNTHRSEVSFDKFWNTAFDGGCRGLLEFRAVESLPKAEWMSAVALLWRALATRLLAQPHTLPLLDHGARLHDAFFLPSELWADLQSTLGDLDAAGLRLPEAVYRTIFEWRFPLMLEHGGAGGLTVRKALEAWPLLCEQPLQGGNTSRFVDTSIERLEFCAATAPTGLGRLFVQGRELKLVAGPSGWRAGLRYRRTALYPSLHPGILPQVPLVVTLTDRGGRPKAAYRLEADARRFTPCEPAPLPAGMAPCRKLQPNLLTYDLRIP